MTDFHRTDLVNLAVFVGDVKEELRPVLAPVIPLVGVEESFALDAIRYPGVAVEYGKENGGSPLVVGVLRITLAQQRASISGLTAADRERRFLAEVDRSTPAADHRFEFAQWSSSTSGMGDATTMMAAEPSAVVSSRGGCGQVVGVCSALAPIEPSLDKARLLLAASADHCSSTGLTSPPVVA